MHSRARALIEELRLEPHPEGGYYREIYRSAATVYPTGGSERRAATTIYFLLTAGSFSRWHRVRSDEVWHLYEGGPLELMLASPGVDESHSVILQPASHLAGPVHAVPADHWQAAAPLGDFALAGCTVAPGFEFADFQFLRGSPEAADRLQRLRPQWARYL